MRRFLKLMIWFWAYVFKCDSNSKVIYYHDISTAFTDMGTDKALFFKHLAIIEKEGFSIVDRITEDKGQVMICFDDGWKGIYENRYIFKERRIHPTVFIAVDLIGEDGYLTYSEINELYSLGFDFQCHTWSHKDLTTFSEVDLKHELIESKSFFERTFNSSFDSICFPQGRFSDMVCKICGIAGYKYIYSSICGSFYDMLGENLVCRNCVQDSSPAEFRFILRSTSSFMRRHFRLMHYSKMVSR